MRQDPDGTDRASSVQPRNSAALVTVLMAGSIGQSLIFMVISPLLPSIVAQYGASGASIAQFIFALPSLGKLIVGLVGGWIVDRMGARRTVVIGLLLYAALGVTPMAADALAPLLVSRLLLGAVCGLVTVALTITVVERYSGHARSAMLGFQSSVGSLAGLIGLVAAGIIASRTDWHFAFLLYALPILPLCAIAVVAMPRDGRVPPDHGVGVAATVGLFWPVYLAAGSLFLATTMFGGLTPFLLIERGIADPFVQSLVIAMVTLGAAAGSALFGAIQKRIGERHAMTLGLSTFALGALGLGVAPNAWTAGGATFLGGIGIGLVFPWLATRVATRAPDLMRTRGFSLLATATFLGGFAYPLVTVPLISLVGRGGAFLVLGAAALLASVGFGLLARSRIDPALAAQTETR